MDIPGKSCLAQIGWLEHLGGPTSPTRSPSGKKPLLVLGRATPAYLQESINALLRTLAARDPYTGQHSVRVTDISIRFGKSLGLSSQDLNSLKIAGHLHDIGKIGVRDTILLKPGPLTPEERAIIETHPLIGETIVEPLGLLPQEKQIILHHHERWNGQGYPQGMAQEEIPLLARVVALADVFDALTTDRPYRPRFHLPEALMEIEAQAGHQFDPVLASQFIRLMSSKPIFPGNIF